MSTFAKYLDVLGRRSKKTSIAYGSAIGLWSRTLGEEPDKALEATRTNPYEALDKWVSYLCSGSLAPKTILLYFSAVKGFFEFGDIELSPSKLKKITRTLPRSNILSTDRAPSLEELRKIFRSSNLKAQTALAILLSSGMRLGELCTLKIGSV